MMNNKMKGLLKGLRYISQIFDEEEKEMQIGYPTDVKHVAHFGSNGSSSNSLSWMSGYHESDSQNEKGRSTLAKETSPLMTNTTQTPAKDTPPNSPAKRRHRCHSSASDSPLDQDKEPKNRGTRQSSRHLSLGASTSANSSSKEPSGGAGSRCGRRHSKISATGGDPPAGDIPVAPKHSTRSRRKSKEQESSSNSY